MSLNPNQPTNKNEGYTEPNFGNIHLNKVHEGEKIHKMPQAGEFCLLELRGSLEGTSRASPTNRTES